MDDVESPWLDLPERIKPQLLSHALKPPPGDWRYELKYDGYRFLARIGEQVRLFTRNGYDWTDRLHSIATELQLLPACAWLDGEVVSIGADGKPSFSEVQSAFSSGRTADLIFFAFDIMHLNGRDLRSTPLEERRALLTELLDDQDRERVRLSETIEAYPQSIIETACRMKLEGVVAKRAGSSYTEKRSSDWVKIKCSNKDTFHIAGHTKGFGSLILGAFSDTGLLEYAGKVQSGLNDKLVGRLRQIVPNLRSDLCTIVDVPASLKKMDIAWLKPALECEVKFTEITSTGRIRHGVLLRLMEPQR